MKVMGIEVPQTLIDAAVARMRVRTAGGAAFGRLIFKSFTLLDIKAAVRAEDEKLSVAAGLGIYKRAEFYEKVAGRVIQEKRKAGYIHRGHGKHWRWDDGEAAAPTKGARDGQ